MSYIRQNSQAGNCKKKREREKKKRKGKKKELCNTNLMSCAGSHVKSLWQHSHLDNVVHGTLYYPVHMKN